MSKMHRGASKIIYQRARELRENATYCEGILWDYLKTKPMGLKFRRQHPYAVYILDFYCHALKLVIEVDGSIHQVEEVRNKDIIRQNALEKDGLIVTRINNDQLLNAPEKVFEELNLLIQKILNEKQ